MLNTTNRNLRFRLLNYFMVMLLIANIFTPYTSSYATDGEIYGAEKIENKTVVVKQAGEDGTLQDITDTVLPDKPIHIEVSFDIPLLDSSGAKTIKTGDVLRFDVVNGLTLTKETTEEVLAESMRAGDLKLLNDTNKIVAELVFDGEAVDSIHSDPGIHEKKISVKFEMDLNAVSSGNSDSESEQTITILEKTFTLKKTEPEIRYSLTKSGEVLKGEPIESGLEGVGKQENYSQKKIKWTVIAEGKKGDKTISLKDLKFSDDLSEVGNYVEGSFSVDGETKTPKYETDSEGKKMLTYTFSEDKAEKATITFETEIPDENFFQQSSQTISNTAKLLSEDEISTLAETSTAVSFTPVWIQKTGEPSDEGMRGSDAPYDPKDRTITWTITANYYEHSLKKAWIEDVLKTDKKNVLGKLTFKSATLKKWNKSSEKWELAELKSIDEEKGIYHLGDIDTKILLEIVTNVPDPKFGFNAAEVTYTNSATLHWDSWGISSGEASEMVGFNAIHKEFNGYKPTTDTIIWKTIVEERQQKIEDLKVYEIFAYDENGFDPNEVTGLPSDVDSAQLKELFGRKKQAKGQQYIEGSFKKGDESSSIDIVHKAARGIYDKTTGKRVGDLVEVSGFKTNQKEEYFLSAKVVSPSIHFKNGSYWMHSTALLFSKNVKLNESFGQKAINTQMMNKRLLKREVLNDPAPAKIFAKTTKNPRDGFHYNKKEVVYRLDINPKKIRFSERKFFDGKYLVKYDKLVFTDTLPKGWVFSKFGAEDYLLFDDKGKKIDTTPEGFSVTTPFDETAVFKFDADKLNQSYIILLKAKPGPLKMEEYFTTNDTHSAVNTLTMKATNLEKEAEALAKVKIENHVMSKDIIDEKRAETEGVLKWQIDYTPTERDHKDVKLEDTLPQGLDLFLDKNGNLQWQIQNDKGENEDTIRITELELQSDGKYKEGKTISPAELKEKYVRYDASSGKKVLTFKLPDGKLGYRINYLTQITGELKTVTNSVKLIGTKAKTQEDKVSFSISKLHVDAMLKRSGYVKITKVDGTNNKTLPGATFALLTEDGTTPLRFATTDKAGQLWLVGIPEGEYILRELTPPSGYKIDKKFEEGVPVKVELKDKKYITTIGTEVTNELTVENFGADVGNLIISKKVSGADLYKKDKDQNRKFTFYIEYDGKDQYPYSTDYGDFGKIRSGQKIELEHGQTFIVSEIPKNKKIKVREVQGEYTVQVTPTQIERETSDKETIIEGKVSAYPKQEIQIIKGENRLDYVNTYTKGGVKVTNKVVGSAADINKFFEFKVDFSDKGKYHYIGENGSPTEIESGKTIRLKHGQSFTIYDMPPGVKVFVTEDPQDYVLIQPGNKTLSIEITAGIIQEFEYINRKDSSGGGRIPSTSGPSSPKPSEDINEDPTPLGGRTQSEDSPQNETIVDEENVPKQGIEKAQKIAGAPKTGFGEMNIMFKNFLTYGTMLLLVLALTEEYKKRS